MEGYSILLNSKGSEKWQRNESFFCTHGARVSSCRPPAREHVWQLPTINCISHFYTFSSFNTLSCSFSFKNQLLHLLLSLTLFITGPCYWHHPPRPKYREWATVATVWFFHSSRYLGSTHPDNLTKFILTHFPYTCPSIPTVPKPELFSDFLPPSFHSSRVHTRPKSLSKV